MDYNNHYRDNDDHNKDDAKTGRYDVYHDKDNTNP